jgi:hypothetical protein
LQIKWDLKIKKKSFRIKSLVARNPFWNRAVSNASREKLLNLLHKNERDISSQQYSAHYSPAGNCDMFSNVEQKNIRRPEVVESELLNSDQLLIIYHLLDRVRTRNVMDPVDNSQIRSGFKSDL